MMDWISVINTLIGVLFGGGIMTLALLRTNKKKAETEVKSSNNKEQAERIDLGEKFVTQSLSMLEKIADVTEKNRNFSETNLYSNRDAFNEINKKVDVIHNEVVDTKSEITSIVAYLNGGYQAFKHNDGPVKDPE